MSGLGGAGPGGGLLFLALIAFVGWLVAAESQGVLRLVLVVVVAVSTMGLAINVLRRR